jgi:hypothetical protein
MQVRQMDGDLMPWTKSYVSERTVEMIIKGNAMERDPVEAGVPYGSPVSPILLMIYISERLKCVEEGISAKGQSIVDDFGLVATGSNHNQVILTLETCAAKSIEWASR